MNVDSSSSERHQPTDINERRKLQNRVAQKKYRTRQKTRMKLAEAVLNDISYFHPAFATIPSKKKSPSAAEGDLLGDSCPDLSTATETRPETHPETRAKTHSTRARQSSNHLTYSSESVDNNQADSGVQPSQCLDRQEVFCGFSGESEFSEGDPQNRMKCIDPVLTHGWLDMDFYSSTPKSSTVIDCGLYTMGANGQLQTKPNFQEAVENLELCESNDRRVRGDLHEVAPGTRSTSSRGCSPTLRNPSTLLLTPSESALSLNIVTSNSSLPAALDESLDDPVMSGVTTPGTMENQSTPLMTAISLGRLDIAKILLKSGATLDTPDDSGKTALHRAVGRGELHVVETLLELGADMLATDHKGNSLLHVAVKTNSLNMTKMLLERYESGKELGETQHRRGCRRHGNQLCDELWINFRNKDGMTAVHLSVLWNRVEILGLLVKHGADVN
uniref:HC-toxin bZIP transcription factor n=1 Tax=Alternaria jesenskae TaxID=378183 RepID=S5FPJ4_9PLEO|nr:HC-toxin bZIP transcription factor [Alternaria jesenskae]